MPQRKSLLSIALTACVVVLAPCLMQAQNGCVTSPENPTAILALIGAAGALAPRLRSYLCSRR
jgi:XrtJ-associated TM-motif-TM protein